MDKFYIVNIWYSGMIGRGGYKVMACAKSLNDAAVTAKVIKKPSMTTIVREGSTGKRYCFADLFDSWTKKIKV